MTQADLILSDNDSALNSYMNCTWSFVVRNQMKKQVCALGETVKGKI